jgi:Glycosyl transferase family 2
VKVTVIIPAYNAATTLADAVVSIERQTAPDWEILIVDDGSHDDTGIIAKALAERDGRIRVIAQANAGESAARNAGISQARYEWLLFLDADDWVAPSHLERLLSVVEADPSLDAVHCGWARVTQNGSEVIEEYRPPTGDLFPVLARRAAFPIHACLVRRAVVESAGLFDTSLRKSPDWDLWQRIARCGATFGSVPEVLSYYRMVPNSASMEAEQMLRDGLTVLRRGHGTDPRVRNPQPQYVNGLAGSTVESQQYYLLSWCAGLLLGTGQDAEQLLRLVSDDKYTGLYPNAIAQCIFDSAPLPSCLARQDWEDLWRRISGPTTAFLKALELQTETAHLAESSVRELKKLILRNSPIWADVIHHEETSAAALQDTIAKMSEGSAWMTADRDEWRSRAQEWERHSAGMVDELSAAERRSAELAADAAGLGAELQAYRRQPEELTLAKEQSRRELGEAEARRAALTVQLQTATGRIDDLERRHAEAVAELACARWTILELEQRVISMDLDLAGGPARIKELEQIKESLDLELTVARARIEELEHHLNSMDLSLTSARGRINELEQHADSIGLDLIALRGKVHDLEQQNQYTSVELGKWRESATARAILIEDLQQDTWMRLGLLLRTTKRRESIPATAETSAAPKPAPGTDPFADPAIEARWHLRVDDRNEANLIYPREDHEMVKIGITKAETGTNWHIQLNRLGLEVAGGVRYTVAFRGRASRPREIGVGVAKAHDPWTTLGMYTTVQLTAEWQTFQEEFVALEDDGDARIHFDLGGRMIGVDLTSVVLRAAERTEELEACAGSDRQAADGRVQ